MRFLTLREQLLIGVLTLVIVGLGVGWGLSGWQGQTQQLERQLAQTQRQLRELEALVAEWNRVQQQPTAPVMGKPLSSFVEEVARALRVQEQLQLNTLSSVPEGMEGVQVRLDQLKLDQLLDVLYRLEHHQPVLRLSQLDLAVSPGSRLVRVSFQVLKQQQS